MEKCKNVTRNEKLGRYSDSKDWTNKTITECLGYVRSKLNEFQTDEDRCILQNIEFYLHELNGEFALETCYVLHDGADYPYVGQHVFCYNSYGKDAEMVYNPEGLEDYEWQIDGYPVLAWMPDSRNYEES